LAHRSEFTLFSPEEKLLYEQAKVVLLNRKVGHGWLSLLPQEQKFEIPEFPEETQERTN